MANPNSNIYCVCRICLAEDKIVNLKNMFNFSIKCSDEKITFGQLFSDYTGITLNVQEDLSPFCCSKCETAMIIAFNFRKAVKESHEFLEHIYKKLQAFENGESNMDSEKAEQVNQLKKKMYSHETYCRFCYMESDSLKNIYEETYKSMSLLDIFKLVGNFTPPKNGLSDSICNSCETQMIQIYDGRLSARKNDAYMKKSLEEALKAIREGKLDIEKYRIDRDQEDDLGSTEPTEGILEPEFIKLEPVEPDDIEIKEEIEDLPDVMQFD
uniref:CSON005189 protein n=1 Tax=Culicoides sonorensis TaxID=179676 RepID=A0A336LLK4_CULSO